MIRRHPTQITYQMKVLQPRQVDPNCLMRWTKESLILIARAPHIYLGLVALEFLIQFALSKVFLVTIQATFQIVMDLAFAISAVLGILCARYADLGRPGLPRLEKLLKPTSLGALAALALLNPALVPQIFTSGLTIEDKSIFPAGCSVAATVGIYAVWGVATFSLVVFRECDAFEAFKLRGIGELQLNFKPVVNATCLVVVLGCIGMVIVPTGWSCVFLWPFMINLGYVCYRDIYEGREESAPQHIPLHVHG